ncbi:LytTR family transcriptional regulator DNA-binding domain-containing protein [uncultured Aquimarina sp.]|jgi:DNA-binding LytR/AlgR family response regulator|uniref:LytTR family transcriptional regulator DNA-binding domain-containing protein n=1 Tax=uncultured Aquimarina sp. TaxID=575652 RepID=UPI002637B109|nr:LytTR family transcriptional regulator DNA-binding domain-containing protein [uncultured Aquimarina sp.]
MTHQTLSSIEELLPKDLIMKAHKSFIISKNKILLIEGNLIQINEHKIPIGKKYR